MASKRSGKKQTTATATKTIEPTPVVPPSRERVIVQGKARRMQSFNLPHEVYCAAMGECFCTERDVVVTVYSRVENGREPRLLRKKKRMNSTLTVRYGKRVAVPRAALSCPEVKSALDKQWLRVTS